MNNNKKIGKDSEQLVSCFLKENGYTILENNWYCKDGEIDIISLIDNTLCIVEVKHLPPTWDSYDIEKKIPVYKQLKIKRATSIYLAHCNNKNYHNIRFDVALVINESVHYYPGAF